MLPDPDKHDRVVIRNQYAVTVDGDGRVVLFEQSAQHRWTAKVIYRWDFVSRQLMRVMPDGTSCTAMVASWVHEAVDRLAAAIP